MGLLIKGKWYDKDYDVAASELAIKNETAELRNWVTVDGQAGETGLSGFKAEANRYHLYVALSCPWAHRAFLYREIKGLKDIISMSIVSPDMLENGWCFDKNSYSTGDDLFGFDYMHQVYTKNKPDYSGRVTVPVLWDKKQCCIVNNESADIMRMFNNAFDDITGNTLDFYPKALQTNIDDMNSFIQSSINSGVYKVGYATEQAVYEQACDDLFVALDKVDEILSVNPYLIGVQLTEADWRLFTTLVRFDVVYHGHFKCNKKLIKEYPALFKYLKGLYQYPGVADTVNFEQIKRHYYYSHKHLNPNQIVPVGMDADYFC